MVSALLIGLLISFSIVCAVLVFRAYRRSLRRELRIWRRLNRDAGLMDFGNTRRERVLIEVLTDAFERTLDALIRVGAVSLKRMRRAELEGEYRELVLETIKFSAGPIDRNWRGPTSLHCADAFNRAMGVLRSVGAVDAARMHAQWRPGTPYYDLVTELLAQAERVGVERLVAEEPQARGMGDGGNS